MAQTGLSPAVANEQVIKEMIAYIEKISSSDIPSNARQWICEVLRNRGMSRFHVHNASQSKVVQVDYNFSGRTASGKTWTMRVSINADSTNTKRGHGPHYGGEVEYTDIHGDSRRAPAIHAWLSHEPADRPNDKLYQMEEYLTGSELKTLDDHGTVALECMSKKTGQ